jgi:hypothetical protein
VLGGWSGAARTRSGFESDGADRGDTPSLPIESGVDGMESAAASAMTSAAPTTTAATSVGFGVTAARLPGRASTTPRGEMTGLAQGLECLLCARSRLSFAVQRAAGAREEGRATAWASGGLRSNRAEMRFIPHPSRDFARVPHPLAEPTEYRTVCEQFL